MSAIVFNPWRIGLEVWQHRYLLGQLIKRDVLLRYRGAMFGVLWIFLSPLFMLAIFAFDFGQIFQSRWPQQAGSLPFRFKSSLAPGARQGSCRLIHAANC